MGIIREDFSADRRLGWWFSGRSTPQKIDIQFVDQGVVNCREFQDLISPAVDRRLKDQEMELFADHAGMCPACRREYETELAVKIAVQKHIKLVPTPRSVKEAIEARLDAEARLDRERPPVASRKKYFRPFAVLAFIALAAIILVSQFQHPTSSTPADDVIQQSLSNYDQLVKGQMNPDLVSDQPAQIQRYLSEKTEFVAMVPAMKGFDLVGATVSDQGGDKRAHVMYRHGTNMLYVYQACWDKVVRGDKLNLAPHVKRELLRNGWYTESSPTGDAVVLWTSGNTLCAAVAHMAAGDLRAEIEPVRDEKLR